MIGRMKTHIRRDSWESVRISYDEIRSQSEESHSTRFFGKAKNLTRRDSWEKRRISLDEILCKSEESHSTRFFETWGETSKTNGTTEESHSTRFLGKAKNLTRRDSCEKQRISSSEILGTSVDEILSPARESYSVRFSPPPENLTA